MPLVHNEAQAVGQHKLGQPLVQLALQQGQRAATAKAASAGASGRRLCRLRGKCGVGRRGGAPRPRVQRARRAGGQGQHAATGGAAAGGACFTDASTSAGGAGIRLLLLLLAAAAARSAAAAAIAAHAAAAAARLPAACAH